MFVPAIDAGTSHARCGCDSDEFALPHRNGRYRLAHQLIRNGIPPCPAVLAEFMAESHRDEPDMRRLSHLVNKDAALAASVVKTVNSPFYGLGRKARTVIYAMTLLGLREASRMIAGFLLRQAFASSSSPAMYEYWDASSHIALTAAYLARELKRRSSTKRIRLRSSAIAAYLLTRFPHYEKLLNATRCSSEPARSIGAHRVWLRPCIGLVPPSRRAGSCRPRSGTRSGFTRVSANRASNDERNERFAHVIAVSLLAEQTHRIHRGTYDEQQWAVEERFIAAVLGPVAEGLEPLSADIARLMGTAVAAAHCFIPVGLHKSAAIIGP